MARPAEWRIETRGNVCESSSKLAPFIRWWQTRNAAVSKTAPCGSVTHPTCQFLHIRKPLSPIARLGEGLRSSWCIQNSDIIRDAEGSEDKNTIQFIKPPAPLQECVIREVLFPQSRELVSRYAHNVKAVGSIPTSATILVSVVNWNITQRYGR